MLTPNQIKEKTFKSSGRNAYKADEVDDFLAELTVDYEKMFRENGELIKRASLLAERLEEYKKDEVDIKSVVISAQKAADMIVSDAEKSVESSKAEAEAVLNAAKSEAALIKSDAEKQAIADSELLLSMTRDKAQEIIKRAKEEASSILLDAKDSASDKMGAANRTVTSETLLFDMMKKEVSDFKASILAQYKAHIELISKLPELAEEKAAELAQSECESKEVIEPETVDAEEAENEVEAEDVLVFESSAEVEEAEDGVLVFEPNEELSEEAEDIGETVVKTDLPFDFFEEENEIEFVEPEISEEQKESALILNETSFDFSADDLTEEEPDNSEDVETEEKVNSAFTLDIGSVNFDADDMAEEVPKNDEISEGDIPISKGFSINYDEVATIDTLDIDEEKEETKKHGFFKHKK